MPFTPEHSLRCRKDFPALTRTRQELNLAYLDGPGGSQVPQAVIEAIGDFYATCNVNTHGNFWPSQEVDRRMAAAREASRGLSRRRSANCISFGQNMTTLNYALSAAIGHTLKQGDEVLITQLDHEANRGPWLRLRARHDRARGAPAATGRLDCGRHGRKDHARAPKCLRWAPRPMRLGTVNDIELARRLTREVGALLVIDAVHYAPHFSLGRQELSAWISSCARATNSTARTSACCIRVRARSIGCPRSA